MNITITARKTTVRDSFKEKVEKKLAKLDKFFGENAKAIVTVTNERDRETVEVTVSAGGMFFRAEKTSEDRLDSLDAVVDSLVRQITRNKSKVSRRLKSGGYAAPVEELTLDEPEDLVEEEGDYQVVRTKRFAVKPMDIQEAILQMNMLGHNFYVFRNSETGEVNVVYRRNNGDYGLIDPVADGGE